jgi:peroxiredoxin
MTIYCTDYEQENYAGNHRWNSLPALVPSKVFHTRVRDEYTGEFDWRDVNSFDLFAGKRVVMFSLPGAFTPTCSTYQLPNFDNLAEEFYSKGFDEIYCMTVNDAFVTNAWAKSLDLSSVKVIPDGTGEFTRDMDMLVSKNNVGFGDRSWRYAVIVDNGSITDWFIEEGKEDDHETDPYVFTNPDYILATL